MSNTRVAIVSGSAQGIGRSIALRLADDGLDVVVNDISTKVQELDSLVAQILAMGRRALAVVGDVSCETDVQRLVDTTVAEFGGLDVMVSNAGIAHLGHLIDTSVEDWDRVQSVNSRGMFLCYKAAAIQMIKQGRGGRIIGASSTAGKRGVPEWGTYCVSKFAVRGLTQSAALELREHGITVNAYCPGAIDTPMWQGVKEIRKRNGLDELAYPEGTPEEIGGLVSYLVREESRFVTGQSLSINGGVQFD